MNINFKDNLFKIRKLNDQEICFVCSKPSDGKQTFYNDLYQCYIKKIKATVCSDCLDKRVSFYEKLNKKEDVIKRIEERIVSRKIQGKQSAERSKEREGKVKKILEIKPDANPKIVEEMVKVNDKLKKINPEMAGDIVEDVKKRVEDITECKKCKEKISKSYSLHDEKGYICDDCHTSEVFESEPFKEKTEPTKEELKLSGEVEEKMVEPEKWCGCGSKRIQIQETYECYQKGDYQCPKCEVVIEKYIEYSLRDGYKMKLPERTPEQIAKLEQDWKEKNDPQTIWLRKQISVEEDLEDSDTR